MIVPGAAAKPGIEAKQKVESKPVVENKAPVEQTGKPRKTGIMIGSVILVVLLGGTSFFAFPVFKSARTSFWTKLGVGGGEGAQKQEVKAMLPLDSFLLNLADTDEIRFVKATFQLGLAEKPEDLSKDSVTMAAIRDSIITLLTSKKADQVLTPQGKDELRREIRSRIKTVAPEIKILEVYIVDFVVQL